MGFILVDENELIVFLFLIYFFMELIIMENIIERSSENTVMLEHVLPHETIGDLTRRAHLEGLQFRVSITVEKVGKKPESESTKRLAALIERLENNNISEKTVEVLEKGVEEFRANFAMRNPFTKERT